ncbi:thymidylate synthase complementing protein ThyX [mine drainage metagenome]|uniref:Thymidylate synthase complementing protein ThyX n=1 Tax=mine drainage metagenome TaxID=410659 RepID=T1AFI1_9ZZZZ
MSGGVVVPPLLQAAGAESDLLRAVQRAEEAVRQLGEDHPAARYLVLNAHRRPVMATLDLGQVCHFIRQRGKADAQWEIRDAAHTLHRKVLEQHPFVWLPGAEGGE